MRTPQRRIDDRLRKLSAKALAASDQEREAVLQELLELVHRKSERLKRRAARLLLKGEQLEGERRTIDLKEVATKPEEKVAPATKSSEKGQRPIDKKTALAN